MAKKNKVIQEMARAMIHNKDVAKDLWGEVVNIACHFVNRVFFKPGTKKTPYKLWKGRKPNVTYFRIFGNTCIIRTKRMWESLTPKAMKGSFSDIPSLAKHTGC